MNEIIDATCGLDALRGLFVKYYSELGCEDDPQYLFNEFIARDLKAGVLSAALILRGDCRGGDGEKADGGDKAVGFVIFQTDDMINDWCFKEGWGDVREIYVDGPFRGRGLGKALLEYAGAALGKEGAKNIYLLPTDDSEGFFRACGYVDIGEYCAELDCKVFGKSVTAKLFQ